MTRISPLSFLCFQLVRASRLLASNRGGAPAPAVLHKEPHPPGTPEFWTKLIVSGFLVLAGGVFAG